MARVKSISLRERDTRIARALIRKLDYVFQRFYHQSLSDVTGEFEVRNLSTGSSPKPLELLKVIRNTGILRMKSEPPVVEMSRAVERFVSGTLGCCERCGSVIPFTVLEENPTQMTCERCQSEITSKIYSSVSQRGSHDHDP